jgi:transcriptional regulator with XRE-family HTH domain
MAQIDPKVVGMQIKKKREALDLSQKKLADQIQVSPPAINQYEKGHKTPSTDVLLRLASAFDVSVDYLLGSTLDEGILVDEEVADAFNLFKGLSPQRRQHAMAHIKFLSTEDKDSD